jgi:hypothetical protein
MPWTCMLQVMPFRSSRRKYSLSKIFPFSSVKSLMYVAICPSKASETMSCGTPELTEIGTSASREGPATTRRRGMGGQVVRYGVARERARVFMVR